MIASIQNPELLPTDIEALNQALAPLTGSHPAEEWADFFSQRLGIQISDINPSEADGPFTMNGASYKRCSERADDSKVDVNGGITIVLRQKRDETQQWVTHVDRVAGTASSFFHFRDF